MALTIAFEAFTCLCRWGLDLQSTRDTTFIAPLTLGVRVHHGYVGVLGAAGAFLFPLHSLVFTWGLRIGLALLISDAIHHFLVLKFTTGHHHFDVRYPELIPIEEETPWE